MSTSIKPRKKTESRNIQRLMLCGDEELFQAFGIRKAKAAEYRSQGMPFLGKAKPFMYDPEDVKVWLKETFQHQQIKTL